MTWDDELAREVLEQFAEYAPGVEYDSRDGGAVELPMIWRGFSRNTPDAADRFLRASEDEQADMRARALAAADRRRAAALSMAPIPAHPSSRDRRRYMSAYYLQNKAHYLEAQRARRALGKKAA